MRAAIQAASGKAEEESIVELLATTTPGSPAKTRQRFRWGGATRPVVVWAPIRAAEDLRDTPEER